MTHLTAIARRIWAWINAYYDSLPGSEQHYWMEAEEFDDE